VNGGTAANTVAETCSADVDFRYLTQVDGEEILERIRQIIQKQIVYNAHLGIYEQVENVELSVFMPPMEHTPENQRIIDVVLEEAQRLGQPMIPITRGGGSDANYTSKNGIPSICGMGAPAEGIHTTQERIHLPFLFERLDLLISTVNRLVDMP
jgi:glutamate carboxypeptidase